MPSMTWKEDVVRHVHCRAHKALDDLLEAPHSHSARREIDGCVRFARAFTAYMYQVEGADVGPFEERRMFEERLLRASNVDITP